MRDIFKMVFFDEAGHIKDEYHTVFDIDLGPDEPEIPGREWREYYAKRPEERQKEKDMKSLSNITFNLFQVSGEDFINNFEKYFNDYKDAKKEEGSTFKLNFTFVMARIAHSKFLREEISKNPVYLEYLEYRKRK